MIEKPQRGNLGRGLAALFGEEEEGFGELDEHGSTKEVPIEQIHPNADQPRRNFTEEALEELSASIRSNGVLQPILVRHHGQRPGEYEIVAGERRWRAAQRAQLHQVPVVVRDIDDGQALELAFLIAGELKQARLASFGTSKKSLFITKKFSFKRSVRNSRAADFRAFPRIFHNFLSA